MSPPIRPLRVAALFSGGGRTLVNLQDRIEEGSLAAEIVTTIASRPDCPGIQRAKARGLPVEVVWRHDYPEEPALHNRLDAVLIASRAELVVLCGYLRRFRVAAPSGLDWSGRVMNIHPALLPDFGGQGMYGDRVHAAVLAAGRTVSGCTVHFVDPIYDHGPIILQRTCPVRPDDDVATLAARVFAVECTTYPQAIQWQAEGRLRIEGGAVVVQAAFPPG
ncbi:MAG: phosphoribosylglycinamide formyltransferase [Phycisphaerales bacterium]|nr:phosphoribosylglycinamide formyltransferase [Phycisphaerales bacterium]